MESKLDSITLKEHNVDVYPNFFLGECLDEWVYFVLFGNFLIRWAPRVSVRGRSIATNINETLETRIGKIIYNVSCGINKKVVRNIDINSTIWLSLDHLTHRHFSSRVGIMKIFGIIQMNFLVKFGQIVSFEWQLNLILVLLHSLILVTEIHWL